MNTKQWLVDHLILYRKFEAWSSCPGKTYKLCIQLDKLALLQNRGRLWSASMADHGDFFVCREEIGANRYSRCVTEGILRALHQKLSKAPWDNCLGLPYHSHLEADYQPLTPGEPAELVFDPAPLVTIYRGADYLLFIELPVNRGVEPGCRKQ